MSNRPLNPNIVRDLVLEDCRLTLSDIMGNTRGARVVFARSIITTVLHDYADMSFPDIARLIRSRASSHATAVLCHKRVKDGSHDDDAAMYFGAGITAEDYARYVWIRADEKTKAGDGFLSRFVRLGDGPEEDAA